MKRSASLFVTVAIVTSCSWLCAGLASAQNTTNPAAAESLFQEAEKLEGAGSYELACGKYAESQRLDPGLGTLLHLAQCYENAGKTASAWGRYSEAMELAVRAGDQRSEIARKRADKLAAMLSKLTISVTPQSQVAGLAVARDGVAVGAAQWNLAIPVDPGQHVVVASAPGYLPAQIKIVTPNRAGEQHVDIPRLTIDPAALKRSEVDDGRGSTQRVVGLAIAGSGAAALLAGSIFGIAAKVAYDKADCSNDVCASPADLDQRQSGFHLATPATVLMIAGGALVAGGAVVYFIAPRSPSKSTGRLQAPRVGFGPTGFVLRGSF